MPQRENIEKLIHEHNRRLQKLKEQEAKLGYSVDPSILLEIEDIEAKVQALQKDLDSLPVLPTMSDGVGKYQSHTRQDSGQVPGQVKPPYFSCFISYSSKDELFAQQLHSNLQQRGVRCWFAPHDMKIGAKIRSTIDRSIQEHDKLLIILSEHSINSDWVEKEVETAFEKEGKHEQLVLFPVRLDDTVMETDEAWAADIRRTRHIGDFSQWEDQNAYQKALRRLLRDLEIKK